MKISKEQKEAIEYYQNKEVSLSVDFDTENLLKTLGITEEDSFENHQIRFKTLLNLIEKLQKENEHLHREINRRIKLKIENEKIVDTQFISIQKVKDKIEELNKEIKSCTEIDAIFKIKQQQILQELLESEE